MFSTASKNGFSLKAWRGSTMTLLAMNFSERPEEGTFAGFSLAYINPKGKKYYIKNLINFEGTNEVTSSYVSPIQLFRWVHFPGSYQQTGILTGEYTYMATPRFFDAEKKLLSLDKSMTVSAKIMVDDFSKGDFSLGFTRAFLKSQAFANRYGAKQKLLPDGDWIFDTNQIAGSKNNVNFTFENMFEWLGFSARRKIYDLLEEALNDETVSVDMYAYDFNDPVIAQICLDLAAKGRIRMIIDNASLHTAPKAEEDDFEQRFIVKAIGSAEIFRCHFARYSHCKIIILKKNDKPYKVLTGSTNFSYTGLYINANHVLVFDNKNVAKYYDDVFNVCWKNGSAPAFRLTEFALNPRKFYKPAVPTTEVNFSPHNPEYATQLIDAITENVVDKTTKSVLFSVMEMGDTTTGSLIPALRELHKNDAIYTYGVTDKVNDDEISLYKPGRKNGLLVNAKAANRELPPPFNKEHSLGLAHAIHHKFVVVNFNKSDAKVYCGSSNLALGGEKENGDNLLCIKDTDVATAFAIEAVRLIDHYNFRSLKDKEESDENSATPKPVKLDNTGKWVDRFYDENDIRCIERKLFA